VIEVQLRWAFTNPADRLELKNELQTGNKNLYCRGHREEGIMMGKRQGIENPSILVFYTNKKQIVTTPNFLTD